MNTQELITALRSTQSRSKRALLDEAADTIERLTRERDLTERERLIELLNTVIFPREGADPAEVVADFLLDNGVVLSEENERLKAQLHECKNELCLHCGKYKDWQNDCCAGCKWEDA